MDPAGFRTAPRSTQTGARQLQLQLASCVQIRSAHAGARVQHEPKRTARRDRFDIQTNQPVAHSNGISAPGFVQADNCEKTAVSGSRRNQKNTRAFCNASGGISTRCATIRACWIESTPNFRRRVLIAIMMDERTGGRFAQPGTPSIFCCSSPSRGWSLARRHRSRAVIATQSDPAFRGHKLNQPRLSTVGRLWAWRFPLVHPAVGCELRVESCCSPSFA